MFGVRVVMWQITNLVTNVVKVDFLANIDKVDLFANIGIEAYAECFTEASYLLTRSVPLHAVKLFYI